MAKKKKAKTLIIKDILLFPFGWVEFFLKDDDDQPQILRVKQPAGAK